MSGVLDFEFCACDWRAMELAVCLSKYVGEEDPLPLCIEFINGFIENTELTPAEIEVGLLANHTIFQTMCSAAVVEAASRFAHMPCIPFPLQALVFSPAGYSRLHQPAHPVQRCLLRRPSQGG